ncbi:SGNH/GDSL hydrolase family protein [Methanogenium marinum]|uniref:SGNH/GDSL hydrolase family protein n=1 Tax=Methanogenium marinum TaxID=348610 RepID=A0A9Q4KVE2_9EURY|nr:SGNH/GDSL hydrolase family protein [Methanogenium marinum]MDE4908166.1 SGNH/GDSL hydrolase family protein [Methanogenium marinum]
MNKEKYFKKIVYLSIFVLLIGELVSFCIVSPSIGPPNLKNQYYTDEYSLIGIQGPTNYTSNSLGIRGRELSVSRESEYRILTVGSSTTKCEYLDDQNEWPHKVEELLNETSDGRKVWVGNIGVSGFTTRENIQQLLSIPDKINPDLVIVLAGAEDIHYLNNSKQIDVYSTRSDENLLDLLKENQRGDIYTGPNVGDFFHPKETSLSYFGHYYLKSFIYDFFEFDERNKISADEYAKKTMEAHLNCTIETEINRVTIAEENDLTEFSRNLNMMVDIAEEKGFRLIFVTQPFSDASLLLLNHEVLNVSWHRDVECINVGAMIPANHYIYYDTEHFTDNGANIMAENIARYLENTNPFF